MLLCLALAGGTAEAATWGGPDLWSDPTAERVELPVPAGLTSGPTVLVGDVDGDGIEDFATAFRATWQEPFREVVVTGRRSLSRATMPARRGVGMRIVGGQIRSISAAGDVDGEGGATSLSCTERTGRLQLAWTSCSGGSTASSTSMLPAPIA